MIFDLLRTPGEWLKVYELIDEYQWPKKKTIKIDEHHLKLLQLINNFKAECVSL